jgi:hypothetical protein
MKVPIGIQSRDVELFRNDWAPDRAGLQFARQLIGRLDRVLNGIVDANAGHRRHDVGRATRCAGGEVRVVVEKVSDGAE